MKKIISVIVLMFVLTGGICYDVFNTHYLSNFCEKQSKKAFYEYAIQEYNKEPEIVKLVVGVDDYMNSDRFTEKALIDKPGYNWNKLGDLLWQ